MFLSYLLPPKVESSLSDVSNSSRLCHVHISTCPVFRKRSNRWFVREELLDDHNKFLAPFVKRIIRKFRVHVVFEVKMIKPMSLYCSQRVSTKFLLLLVVFGRCSIGVNYNVFGILKHLNVRWKVKANTDGIDVVKQRWKGSSCASPLYPILRSLQIPSKVKLSREEESIDDLN